MPTSAVVPKNNSDKPARATLYVDSMRVTRQPLTASCLVRIPFHPLPRTRQRPGEPCGPTSCRPCPQERFHLSRRHQITRSPGKMATRSRPSNQGSGQGAGRQDPHFHTASREFRGPADCDDCSH
jgi:hypothetical protein